MRNAHLRFCPSPRAQAKSSVNAGARSAQSQKSEKTNTPIVASVRSHDCAMRSRTTSSTKHRSSVNKMFSPNRPTSGAARMSAGCEISANTPSRSA